MYSSTLTTLSLLPLALSTPIMPRTSTSTASSFHLIALPQHTLPPPLYPLATGKWAVQVTSAPQHAILQSTSGLSPRVFYEYSPSDGCTAVGSASIWLVVTPGGSATVPSNNLVELKMNNGTEGVAIKQNAAGVPVLTYKDGKGSFMACKVDETGEIVLRYREEGQRVLEGCVDVDLEAECSERAGLEQLGSPREVVCV